METFFELDETQEPLIFYLSTFELILSTDYPSEVMALYSFYYAKTKWEEKRTNKEMDALAMKTVFKKWGKEKFKKIKQILYDIHLVEVVNEYNYIHLFPY